VTPILEQPGRLRFEVKWRIAATSVVVGLVVYACWEFSSGGVNHPLLEEVAALPFSAAAAVAAWLASRRCALDPRVRSAWRWIAASSSFLVAAYGSTAGYQLVTGAVPFPSIVDVFFLLFYPVFLIGILRFPTRRESRHARIRLGLDAATIVLAGGSIIWYLVLGPTVAAGGSNLLIRIVSGAYPTGDLLQIFAMARLLTRVRTPAIQVPLRFFAAALLAGVFGDVMFGWLQFHPNARGLLAAHFSLVLAAALAFLAATSQRAVAAAPAFVVAEPERDDAGRGKAIWLPYFAPLVVLGLLVHSQLHASFFSRLSLTIAAGIVMLLVALRQLAARRELIAAHRITNQQAAELRRVVVELKEAHRIQEEFIALVSHELRTPLTSIRGYTELLLEEGLTGDQRDYLNVVDRNSERLLTVVDDLLLVEQIETGTIPLDLGEVVLNDLIEQAGEAAKPIATSRNIGLEIVTDPGLVTSGDASRLGQVLDNLISNALKYTPKGGNVSVTTTRVGGNALIEVADSGIGIPAAEQDQMFDRFFRTSNARLAAIPGTGLGLVVTRGIVEGHGGTIGFESTEGVGTTFRVVIPMRPAPHLKLVA
jgi:signal transduction histidine kinase